MQTGGFDLTDRMQQLLRRAHIDTGDMELVRKIKEECCRVREADEPEDTSTGTHEFDDA